MSYDTGMKEGVIQVVEHLLPCLHQRTLSAALWYVGGLPPIGRDRVTTWILEYLQYMKPTLVCYQHVDVTAANLVGLDYWCLVDEPPEDGEVICLVGQKVPSENGKYIYTGHLQPLIR